MCRIGEIHCRAARNPGDCLVKQRRLGHGVPAYIAGKSGPDPAVFVDKTGVL